MRILITAIGNRSRGDDGVAPLLLDRIAGKLQSIDGVSFVTEEVYQLQPEYIYDIEAADAWLLLDAGQGLATATSLCAIQVNRAARVGTHTLSPDNLLGLYQNLLQKSPPPARLLTLNASEFGFTETLSATSRRAIEQAEVFLLERLARPASFFDELGAGRAMAGLA